MREIEEEWSGFMHEHEFPIKALTCTGKTTPQGLSDYGFINTTYILQESKERTNSRSDTVEENSGKDNNDVPLYSSTPKSVGQTRDLLKKKSMCLTAATSTPERVTKTSGWTTVK